MCRALRRAAGYTTRLRACQRNGLAARIVTIAMTAAVALGTCLDVPAAATSAATEFSSAAVTTVGLAEHSPLASGAQPAEHAISAARSRSKPYFACAPPSRTMTRRRKKAALRARATCYLVIDPPALTAATGVAPALAAPLYEGSGVGGGYAPADLQSAYRIPTSESSPQTIALVDAYGYAAAESDLAKYREQYGLGPCTKASGCFRKVNQRGEEANYPVGNEGWEGESALDLDMASAACSGCHLLLVQATSPSLENLAEAVDTAAALGATEISNSYGLPEGVFADKEERELFNKYYEHPGVVVTVSSGDNGYDNHLEGAASPSYPATAGAVIAVGGTNLRKASNSRGWSEEVWNASGSGCSVFVTKPAWQSDHPCARRTDNDVAAVAGTETPVSFYVNGGWTLAGGTSVASPLVAGIEAHASASVRSLGAHAFYSDPASLFDVTSGSNGTCAPPAEDEYLCHGEVGYDGPTGLGTPDGVPSGGPGVQTKPASEVKQSSATLNATVNPNGTEVTECKFEYGTSAEYGKSVPCAPAPGSGSSPVAVSAPISGLTPGFSYHFRVSAANALATSQGADETFTTASGATSATFGKTTIGASSDTFGPERKRVMRYALTDWKGAALGAGLRD
jgi:hypothetical protein